MNKTMLVTTMLVAAAMFAAVAIAQTSQESVFENGAERENETAGPDDLGDKNGHGAGERSLHGLCNAWNANENGRENGNASEAPPFVWLQERAAENGTEVSLFCEQVPHPSDNAPGRSDDAPRGPPADRGRGNTSGEAESEDEENRPGNNGNGGGNGNGQGNDRGNGSGDDEDEQEDEEEEEEEEEDEEEEDEEE